MVTNVPVDQNYELLRTELAAMSDNIAWLIQDFDKLDRHRRNMMEELKALRDITLFYNERHPELHVKVTPAPPKEDSTQGPKQQHGNTTSPDEPGPLTAPAVENKDGDREIKKKI